MVNMQRYKTPIIVHAISGRGIKVCMQPHGFVCILSAPSRRHWSGVV